MSESVWDIIQERKDKFKTRCNTFEMFPVGCRARVITIGQDFNFFDGTEAGTVVRNTGQYLGIELKFDKSRHFDNGHVQTSFNFAPDDLIRLSPESRGEPPMTNPKISEKEMTNFLATMTDIGDFEDAQVIAAIRAAIEERGRLREKAKEWREAARLAYHGTSGDRIALIIAIRDFKLDGEEEPAPRRENDNG